MPDQPSPDASEEAEENPSAKSAREMIKVLDLLLEAHADLLRFVVRHGLIEAHLAAKSEKNLAMLKAKLGFPG